MIVRSSFFAAIKECPYKAHLKYNLGLARIGHMNVDTFFGAILHDAIDVYNKTGDIEDGIKCLQSVEWPPHKVKNTSRAIVLLRIYVKESPTDGSRKFSEREFSFPIGNHTWKGRFDSLLENNNGEFVEENKTTKPRFLQLKPNDQFISYVYGAQILYNKRFAGIIINDLDPEKIALTRQYISYTDAEFEHWLKETEVALNAFEFYNETSTYPKHPNSCNSYGVDHQCEFYTLCTTPKDMVEKMMQTQYGIDRKSKELSW